MATPPRSRLGRGLGALLSMTETPPETTAPVLTLPSAPPASPFSDNPLADVPATGERLATLSIDSIAVNPHQPRKEFEQAALDTLADSIKANGVIQPIVVRPLADGKFELIAGERRLRAARQAKLADIPAVIRNVDGYTQAQWALVENIHREDLNPMDRAEAYAALMQQLGLTQAELAGRLGEQRSSVANYLRLLDLNVGLRDDLRRGSLSFGHAKVLAGVSSPAEQLRLAQLVTSQHLSIRNLERLIEQSSDVNESESIDAPPNRTEASTKLHLQEVEQQLIQQLGLRVQLRGGKKSGTGKVVIHYRSLEEFDELVRRCGIQLSNE